MYSSLATKYDTTDYIYSVIADVWHFIDIGEQFEGITV